MSNEKYYRLTKDSATHKKGAIFQKKEVNYSAISDLWDEESLKNGVSWAECPAVIENSPEWYERVYELSLLGKTKYAIKEIAQKRYEETYREED